MKISEIDKEALNLILHASEHSHPNEFVGILRSEDKRITEVLLLPGTFSSEKSAFLKIQMLPISSNSCGSVHSHTSPRAKPSSADLAFFNKFGDVHIIVATPYNENSWRSYDRKGREVKLETVESERGESTSEKFHEDFFEFPSRGLDNLSRERK